MYRISIFSDQLKVPERPVTKPLRLCVGDVFKGQGASIVLGGRLETGYVQNADRLLLVPQNEILTVKNVLPDSGDLGMGFAGDQVSLTVTGVDTNVPRVGDFICDPTDPIPLATRIEARVVIFNIVTPIIRGTQFYIHYQNINESVKVSKLVSILHKSNGQVTKLKPRALLKNSTAVIELSFPRPIPIHCYK